MQSFFPAFLVTSLKLSESVLDKKEAPRDDYKEFLILTLIFLGKFDGEVKFSPPGPIHHARWMAKAIYCLKIYLFRHQFEFEDEEKENIQDLCLFIVKLYIQAWFNAPTAKAPNHDLQFLAKLDEYANIDPIISEAGIKKLINHLWYLIPEMCALSFFDEEVSEEMKRKMVFSLSKNVALRNSEKRLTLNRISELEGLDLADFVNSGTTKFFDRFGLETDFLVKDPSTWLNDECYQNNLKKIVKLKSVNDVAERGVKLIEEYNGLLTKNQEQQQFMLQVVSDYRRKYPNCNKALLSQPLSL